MVNATYCNWFDVGVRGVKDIGSNADVSSIYC